MATRHFFFFFFVFLILIHFIQTVYFIKNIFLDVQFMENIFFFKKSTPNKTLIVRILVSWYKLAELF
jgi:hypothetical protein